MRKSVVALLLGCVITAGCADGASPGAPTATTPAAKGADPSLASLSHALAIASKGQDWIFWTVQQTVLFPLLLLSGMLLPIEGGPGWMQALSKGNPLTYIVDAMRDLFAGSFDTGMLLEGTAAALLVCALGVAVGVRSMRAAD